jgi:hypothetical protein
VALVILYGVLLAFPEIVFSETIAYKNFRVHSYQPIDDNIYRILDRVSARLASSGIDDPGAIHRIFLCNSHALYGFFAPRSAGSFGVSYGVLRETFLAPSDVALEIVTRSALSHRTRRLSSVIAHELTHLLLVRRFGLMRDYWTPAWKKEGFCEYVAGDTTLRSDDGVKHLREGRNDQSGPARYFFYYAAMKYLIDVKCDRIEQIFADDYPVRDPESLREVLAGATGH